MKVILSAQADAFNDTDSQMTKIEGGLVVLDDLAAGHDALNTPDPLANAILVLIEVLTDQVAKLWELHDAEWKALNAGPLAAAAE